MRARRLLRRLAEPARERARRRHRSSDHPLARAGRDMVLVLHRRRRPGHPRGAWRDPDPAQPAAVRKPELNGAMPVLAIADMYGISGRRDELVAALADAEREAVARPGCVRYGFAAAVADPDRFVLVGEWHDKAAMDAHYGSESFARFQFALDGLLARPSEMTGYQVTRPGRPGGPGAVGPRDARRAR